nr:hypothetical protein [Tanacetum cinerariifolium]
MMREWMVRQTEANEQIKNQEDKTQPIPTMPNLSPIKSKSPTLTTFHKDCIMHVPYTNVKTFAHDVLLNQSSDEEVKSINEVGIARITKEEIKKDDMGFPRNPTKSGS